MSSIPAQSHTFVVIDHEIITMVILLLSEYVHEVLVNCLFKLAQEKVWLGELICPTMTIAVDLERKAAKQTNKQTIPNWKILFTCIIRHVGSLSEKSAYFAHFLW